MSRVRVRFTALLFVLVYVFSFFSVSSNSDGILSIYKNHPQDVAPFCAENMVPGDCVEKSYTVNVSLSGTVNLNFQARIKEDSGKLSEVLNVIVTCENTSEVLYEGLLSSMPVITTQVYASHAATHGITYKIAVWLDTSVGNEYQNKSLSADFFWWAETRYPTTDQTLPTAIEKYSVTYLYEDGTGDFFTCGSLQKGEVHTVKSPSELNGFTFPDGKEFVSWRMISCSCHEASCDLKKREYFAGDEFYLHDGNVVFAPVFKDTHIPDIPAKDTFFVTYIAGEGQGDPYNDTFVFLQEYTFKDFMFDVPKEKEFDFWEIIECNCGDENCRLTGLKFLPQSEAVFHGANVVACATYRTLPTGELVDVPKTGDSSNIFLWIVIMVLCVIIAILLLSKKEPRDKTPKKLSRGIAVCVVIIILLALLLSITTFALLKSVVSIETNIFKTAEVKINLNDSEPIITPEFLFEPGMTVEKEFFIKNEGTIPVYYRVFFEDIRGGLASVLDITISTESEVLFNGKVSDFVSSSPHLKSSILAVDETVRLKAVFHYPKESKNDTQNLNLSFILCAEATQTKNNPLKVFS